MGTPKTYGPDTSVPGITSATIKKGGKGKPDEKVPQVDISQSLAWFDQAAQTQTEYYQKGLEYYQTSLKAAAMSVQEGYRQANNTLKPLSFASNQALNEQMRMLGLDPIQAAFSYGDQLRATAKNYRESGVNVGPEFDQMANQMNEALKIRDPYAREQAKQSILSTTKNVLQQTEQNLQQKLEQATAISYTKPNLQDSKYTRNYQYEDRKNNNVLKDQFMQDKRAFEEDLAAYNTQSAARQAGVDSSQASLDRYKLAAGDISQITDQFNSAYTKEYDAGYTGDQVAAKIEATPGYKFQMDQGTKAIERQGAAAGMLGSGNTLTALTNYGQGLAQNFYGTYMDNLSKIVAEGSGATAQIASNQVNEGKDYGSLAEAGGQAGMNTSRLIGDAQANSMYQKGKLFAENAQFNASMQFQGIQGGLGRQAAMAQQAVSSGPSYMAAQTDQQRFNYGVFQQQQGGQTVAAGRV